MPLHPAAPVTGASRGHLRAEWALSSMPGLVLLLVGLSRAVRSWRRGESTIPALFSGLPRAEVKVPFQDSLPLRAVPYWLASSFSSQAETKQNKKQLSPLRGIWRCSPRCHHSPSRELTLPASRSARKRSGCAWHKGADEARPFQSPLGGGRVRSGFILKNYLAGAVTETECQSPKGLRNCLCAPLLCGGRTEAHPWAVADPRGDLPSGLRWRCSCTCLCSHVFLTSLLP